MLPYEHSIAGLFVCLFCCRARAPAPAPIPVKVVVIALFEPGADQGDTPGEYQYWVEREHLDHIYPFPQGYHDLRMNDQGVMGVLAGVGTARAAASIMALGLDPRFDFSKAYWLVAGIAGADPEDASLGSAAWAEWVVDGDLAYEIDAREIPPQWTTGYVPLDKTVPYEQPRTEENRRRVSSQSRAEGMGLPADKSRQARRFSGAGGGARALCRSERAPAALRPQGRYAFRLHFLARQITRSMGQSMGQLSDRWRRAILSRPPWKTAAFCNRSPFFIMPDASTWIG